ncbi:hypothetical protein HPB47_004633 [Ixodes persulcatus]|uniref:Uncharacterized protein n=1 Tax=Ixodes persulcatus TaxID=34615 RepID=A0AC60PF53_IXOPE|nr:hypothetical protein HPB47_004633 [Ixodes persulcatus]
MWRSSGRALRMSSQPELVRIRASFIRTGDPTCMCVNTMLLSQQPCSTTEWNSFLLVEGRLLFFGSLGRHTAAVHGTHNAWKPPLAFEVAATRASCVYHCITEGAHRAHTNTISETTKWRVLL